jgi:hypothetical protein
MRHWQRRRSRVTVTLTRAGHAVATVFDLLGDAENDMSAAVGYAAAHWRFLARARRRVHNRGALGRMVVRSAATRGRAARECVAPPLASRLMCPAGGSPPGAARTRAPRSRGGRSFGTRTRPPSRARAGTTAPPGCHVSAPAAAAVKRESSMDEGPTPLRRARVRDKTGDKTGPSALTHRVESRHHVRITPCEAVRRRLA